MPKPKDDLTKRIGTKNAARIKAIVKRAKAEGKSPKEIKAAVHAACKKLGLGDPSIVADRYVKGPGDGD